MAKRKEIWVVYVADEEDNDMDYVLLFDTEAMAKKAVDYYKAETGDLEAYILQSQHVVTDWKVFKQETDDYFEERYADSESEGEDEEDEEE